MDSGPERMVQIGQIESLTWEQRKALKWLLIAEFMAQQLSKDLSTKVGAIILDRKRWSVRSTGYNGMAAGVDDTIASRHERPEKYEWMAHAEPNAIAQAARAGTAIEGCVMVVNGLIPCHRCADQIINAGIAHVFVLLPESDVTRWNESNGRALQKFREAKLPVTGMSRDGKLVEYFIREDSHDQPE